jgi:DNA-binding CsgD family transcriptional regulator
MGDRAPELGRRTSLLGRSSECALLEDLVSAIRRGEGRSLVVWGEAGIGKTALLEYVVEVASDLTVVRAVGVESEMELAYASLHQLCAALLDRLGRLPAPQRDALGVVFGLTTGPAPDRFLVGLSVLSLLSEVAEEGPLLCVVDDSQWLDQASALTLAFLARRLLAEPVGIVFAAREPGDELQQISDLEVRRLRNGDARALFGSAVRLKLDERVSERIIAETRGNPLALLELPRGLTATELAGGFGLVEAQGLTGRIEEGFVRRLNTLSDDARRLLLLAAAEPVGDPLLLWRAAERLGIGPTVAEDAEAQGMLSLGERVTFRHPLVRSAVYRSAAVRERRAAHRSLAEVTDGNIDPDRRAWHLAAATAGPDERVAVELERSAGRAQARGGLAAAAAFMQRSVFLSGDPAQRARRALAAARASLDAGAFDGALGLLATADAGTLDELQMAQVELLRGEIAFASGLGSDAPPLLMKAARRLEPSDLELARETYLNACGAAMFAGPASAGDLLKLCRAVRALQPPTQASRALDVLLDGLALLFTEGRAAAAPTLLQAANAFSGEDVPIDECLRWGWMATAASNSLWDDDGVHAICARQIQLARDAGALEQLPMYLLALAAATARSGDFGAAAAIIAEIDAVTEATGARVASQVALLVLALRGREAEASALLEATIKQAADWGQGIAATVAHWAAAILYNGLGRYEDARRAAEEASSAPLDMFAAMWALPELIEAAIRGAADEAARDALERLAETTRPAGTEFGLGVEARSRALLAEGAAADELYREAIDRLSRTRLRPELARAHLLYGEWLRRENRRVDARMQLRVAHDWFTSIGMEAFAERARRELLATGEKVPRRTVETRDDLTAHERQIAHLALDGLSNAEIGARLFLSPRTVEWHLRKVFTKLGIHSRRELSKALPSSDPELVRA